jgi:hypothetical protein
LQLRIVVPESHVSAEVLNPALETVTRLNERLLAEGRAPTFDEGVRHGVRWRPEPAGQPESFDHAESVIKRGWGDCDDLAPWAAATMRASGEDPGARAVVRRSGPGTWHAYVLTSDGKERDPSIEAGMGKRGVSGIGAAAVPPMFDTSIEGFARPAIAVRRIVTSRGVVGFDARVDVPVTTSDFAISTLERRKLASQAIIGAIMGACEWADVAGAEDEALARLYSIAGILGGEDDPRDLIRVFGRSAVVGALPFARTLASELGAEVGFNFGNFLKALSPIAKVLEPVASTALSFVPGVGPIASKALDIATSAAMNPKGMAQAALDAMTKQASSTFNVLPGAHIELEA